MSTEERERILALRKSAGVPWHGPPHGFEKGWFHVSAACYEHNPILGSSPERMAVFERDLLQAANAEAVHVLAWAVLPTHYRLLVQIISLPKFRKALGHLHNWTATQWNREDDIKGRGCWYRCLPKEIKNEDHKIATMNYIHHNPVHHGYVKRWQEWPFSSAAKCIEHWGRAATEKMWREYPLLGLGKGWDDPEL